jgi:hypothetical protein
MDSKFRFRESEPDVKRVIEPHWLAAFRCVPESVSGIRILRGMLYFDETNPPDGDPDRKPTGPGRDRRTGCRPKAWQVHRRTPVKENADISQEELARRLAASSGPPAPRIFPQVGRGLIDARSRVGCQNFRHAPAVLAASSDGVYRTMS